MPLTDGIKSVNPSYKMTLIGDEDVKGKGKY